MRRHALPNNGDGTFRDVSRESGIAAVPGWGMGSICADYDNDGGPRTFSSANDGAANLLFQNDGRGQVPRGGPGCRQSAYNFDGDVHGNMGVECGDYNNDGRLDFYVTAYQQQMPSLFTNLGRGQLQDTTLTSAAGLATRRNVTWGCGMVDFDNDGDKDLFVGLRARAGQRGADRRHHVLRGAPISAAEYWATANS